MKNVNMAGTEERLIQSLLVPELNKYLNRGWGGGGWGGEGTRLPYSLGGGVPLGSRKSYPLLDREEILQIFVILLQFMSA